MKIIYLFGLVLALGACKSRENKILDEFQEVNADGWGWNDGKSFSFEIEDSNYLYSLECDLRISGGFRYSNIWLLYTLDGPQTATKNQFQIQLSDNTGKWLGEGKSNLIAFRQVFLADKKLKKGKYILKLNQNMRDDKLRFVSDIGLKIYRSNRIY